MKACLKRPTCVSVRYTNTYLTLSFDYLLPSNCVVLKNCIAGPFKLTAQKNNTLTKACQRSCNRPFFYNEKKKRRTLLNLVKNHLIYQTTSQVPFTGRFVLAVINSHSQLRGRTQHIEHLRAKPHYYQFWKLHVRKNLNSFCESQLQVFFVKNLVWPLGEKKNWPVRIYPQIPSNTWNSQNKIKNETYMGLKTPLTLTFLHPHSNFSHFKLKMQNPIFDVSFASAFVTYL